MDFTDNSGTLRLDGVDYRFEIRGGERFINGLPAHEFMNSLPKKTLLRILIQGMTSGK